MKLSQYVLTLALPIVLSIAGFFGGFTIFSAAVDSGSWGASASSSIDEPPIEQPASHLAPEAREYCLGQGYDYDMLVADQQWDDCLLDYWRPTRIKSHPEILKYMRYRDSHCHPGVELCGSPQIIQNPPEPEWWDEVVLSDPERFGGQYVEPAS